MALVFASLGALVYYLSQSIHDRPVFDNGKRSQYDILQKDNYQIFEDWDVGRVQPKVNQSAYSNVILNEDVNITRSTDPGDVMDVLNNTLRFQDELRRRNLQMGRLNFNPDNRKTVIIPSYATKVVSLNVPNPAVVPGYENLPTYYVDRYYSNIPPDLLAINFKDPCGDVTDLRMPRDNLIALHSIGNPWGPLGVYNKALIEGGNRLAGTFDLEDDTTQTFPRHVHFANHFTQ